MNNKKILSKDEIKQREIDFQALQNDYFENNSKQSWNKMWEYVYDACSNSAKKQLSVLTDDFYGKVMNATCDCMNKIKNGEHIKKLSSFVYLYVRGRLFEPKTRKFEQCISYDYYIESFAEKEKELM